jgi:hypothetical protein
MSDIPLFVFEEHNEAFFAWHYAIANQMMTAKNNILLHVDEHSDFKIPRFNYPLSSVGNNLKNIYQFTYNELSIANFIIPAVYQGIFNQVYWIYQSFKANYPDSVYVYSYDRQGKFLATKSDKSLKPVNLFDPDYHLTKYQALKIDEEFPQAKSVILDIDLDYFSCNHQYYNFKGKLEVSSKQYYEFIEDKYHFLRSTLGSGITAQKRGDKYFLYFNNFEESKTSPNYLKVSESEIIHRISKFVSFLKFHQVKPQIIDICRSRLSGYTPENQWRFIEENLIQQLTELYSLELIYLDQLQSEKIAS